MAGRSTAILLIEGKRRSSWAKPGVTNTMILPHDEMMVAQLPDWSVTAGPYALGRSDLRSWCTRLRANHKHVLRHASGPECGFQSGVAWLAMLHVRDPF